MIPLSTYQEHLDRVSRSFAFCIRKLEPPFRQWVSLSYLLCRALDTIEDTAFESAELQSEQYRLFHEFLERAPARAEVTAWSARFPSTIPEGEKLLLADCFEFFEDLHSLPSEARAVILSTIGTMHRGMQFYSERTRRTQGGLLRLTDLTDVNRYCYFVAGVVGELLSGLYRAYRPDFQPDERFEQNAVHFGLFLQKINLLKDQKGDEKEGRFLVPDRAALLSSLRLNARAAMDYLLSLPANEKGYRTFCAWSLFLGAASLPYIQEDFALADGISGARKIPRSVTESLLSAIESIVQDNVTLENSFNEYVQFLPEAGPAPSTEEAQWFLELTRGNLGASQMTELGML